MVSRASCESEGDHLLFRSEPPALWWCVFPQRLMRVVSPLKKHELHPAGEERQILKSNQLMPEAASSFFLPALTSMGCKETFILYFASGVLSILQTLVSLHFHNTRNNWNTRLPSSQYAVGVFFGFCSVLFCFFLDCHIQMSLQSIIS